MYPIEYPLVIAHRGFSAKYPENTLISFQAALDAGVQMIEFDVTLTRDRQIVVIHDDTLERTTNGKGKVETFSLAELKTLDAGTWFNARFSGERIPTLPEVINLVGTRALMNIEIKSSAHEKHRPADAIEKQVVALIQKYNIQDRILISSFKWEFLENIRQLDDDLSLALLSKESARPEEIESGIRLKAFSWNQNQRKCDPHNISLLHDAGLRVFAYTVNSTDRFKALMEMGVDGIFSDNAPALSIS